MALGMNIHMQPSCVVTAEAQVGLFVESSFGNRYLDNPEAGLRLCMQLTTGGVKGPKSVDQLGEFRRLLEEEFLPAIQPFFVDGGQETRRLAKGICCELEELLRFPELGRCRTVAVGGMFSAGKSRFLNTILGCQVLPTDTNPTTSIPTYVTHGGQDIVKVLNHFDAWIDIDDETLQAICHSFHDRYGVSFSDALRLVHVQRRDLAYPGVAFLDTPGYSKIDSLDSSANLDEHIAREHLRRADCLIWLIDIQNGCLPAADLDFLRSLEFGRPILFVLNKADKKTDTEIAQALGATQKCLERESGIRVYGVTAFSAVDGVECSRQALLPGFLGEAAKGSPSIACLKEMERMYDEAIALHRQRKEALRNRRGVLNEAATSFAVEFELRQKIKGFVEGLNTDMAALEKMEEKLILSRRDIFHFLESLFQKYERVLRQESNMVNTVIINSASRSGHKIEKNNDIFSKMYRSFIDKTSRENEKLSCDKEEKDILIEESEYQCFQFKLFDIWKILGSATSLKNNKINAEKCSVEGLMTNR